MERGFTISVIGLGLIGGSILKKLKNTENKLIGVSRRQETIDKAFEEGLISEGSVKLDVIKNSDFVFVCSPINKTLQIIIDAGKITKTSAIITDVASIKSPITDFINKSNDPINFIGGHPMAGTEYKGLDSSFAELFEGAKWVLTPCRWTTKDSINLLKNLIEKLGAETIIAEPDEHDKAVALISHMPLLLSQSLYSLVKNHPDKKTGDLAMQLASSGFRDMTRLAATNPELSIDMIMENKENVVNAMKELIQEYSVIEKKLKEEQAYTKICFDLARSREKIYSKEGKNFYKGLNL